MLCSNVSIWKIQNTFLQFSFPTTRLFALCKPTITLHLEIMEIYTALNQTDDELGKSSLDSHTRIGLSRPRSPYRWFASGFFAALTTTLVFALSYAAINKRGTPLGLIPDCKLKSYRWYAGFLRCSVPTVEVTFEPHMEFSNLTNGEWPNHPPNVQIWLNHPSY
jgi:hypothetical protein